MIACQLALGCATWVVKYGWPQWATEYGASAGYIVQNESMLQAAIITGHVATGSLILATAAATALVAFKLQRSQPKERTSQSTVASLAAGPSPQGALA